MLPSFLVANPQLQSIWFGLRRLLQNRRVVAIASDQRLVCCWQSKGLWHRRSGLWPPDGTRDGLPLQREAIADLLAELLFDCDVVGAQVELVLPILGSHWCVLEGVTQEQSKNPTGLLDTIADLNWPLKSAESYAAITPCVDQTLLVGCRRSFLQAWIDVVEMADLPLRRVDWLLSSAQRGLLLEQEEWCGDLAWVFAEGSSYRLVVLRAGLPELDCHIQLDNNDNLAVELRRRVAAWQIFSGSSPPLAWSLCLPESLVAQLEPLIDVDRGETSFGSDVPWMPQALTAEDAEQGLLPMERLALQGMREDIYQ